MPPAQSPWIYRLGLTLTAAVAALVLMDRFQLLPALRPVTTLLYGWALLLAAFALLLGIGNVVWVHVRRVQQGAAEWPLSLLLVGSLLLVFLAGSIGPGGATAPLMEWLFSALIGPGQATLFALTGVFVLIAAYRYLRLDRADGLWILAGTLLVLLLQTPSSYAALPPVLVDLADWLLDWPVMAALRGVLLGGGLAALLVILRLLVQRGVGRG